ncbi:hypothetical protein KFE25_013953 [Diacronema lutheri]|uniref:Uncharacterized protein n=1 Tax=Diacronema lutheri TaxID=2081491 RepID=A0A8J6C6H0_DIALT|nr:hypothetical protein KFE25_013953 [Diacronema lutheri]
MARAVALIGSSGGGGATLGHGDPNALRAALDWQLAAIGGGARIVEAQLVVCAAPLDFAAGAERASLWACGGEGELVCVARGSLAQVNARAHELDARLAERLAAGALHGLVSVSADARPGGVNARALKAAGRAALPVAGTGGSSLSMAAAEYGCVLVGNSGGSVATTPESKAIGVAAALAAAWREHFAPASASGGGAWHAPIDGCLPVFLAVACAATLADRAAPLLPPPLASAAAAFAGALRARALPPAVGAIAAQHRSGLGELSVLGGALVGALSRDSPLCALLAAAALAAAAPRCMAACARASVPATATSILVAGALPACIGAAAHAAAPACAALTSHARALLALALGGARGAPLVARGACGAVVGAGVHWGSRRGFYHALVLPLIALEAERGEMALLGALDLLALCVVGAGACAAQLALPRAASGARDAPLARRGLALNLGCGDYVEACFPFLARDRALDAAALCASAAAGALCASAGGVRSTAYVPLPVAVVLSDAPRALVRAALVAFCAPFAVGVACNAAANARGARGGGGARTPRDE